MTQMMIARKGETSEEMKMILQNEVIAGDELINGVSTGTIVIPANRNRNLRKPIAIGNGVKTKVNANIGTSTDDCDENRELEKLEVSEKAGADTFMDLSTAGNIDSIRRRLIGQASIPIWNSPNLSSTY